MKMMIIYKLNTIGDFHSYVDDSYNFVYPLTLAVLEIKIMMYQGRQAFHLLRQTYA